MYRYQLDGSRGEPKKKVDCPYCGRRKKFTLYKDYGTGEYIASHVGKCDSEDKCQAHVPPKEFFKQNPSKREIGIVAPYIPPLKSEVDIPKPFLQETLKEYDKNSFIKALLTYFTKHEIKQAIEDYFIGTVNSGFTEEVRLSSLPTVFWFINVWGKVRAGQIKLFDKECKTMPLQQGENPIKVYWIHKLIAKNYKKQKRPLPSWLNDYDTLAKITCLYGEHLLLKYPNKPVALCEAPKSAIIGSILYPQFVWLATGSLSNLTKERCIVLAGRKVHLFPDTGIPNKRTGKTCKDLWQERIDTFADIADFTVETILDAYTNDIQKEAGYDIADYFIQKAINKLRIKFNLSDFVAELGGLRTGKDFGFLCLYTFRLTDGRIVDILSNREGKIPVTSGPFIDPLAKWFSKKFIEVWICGEKYLMHFAK